MLQILERLFGAADKTVLVTGGSRGIGRMIAAAFVDAGATVVITARHADECAETAEQLNSTGAGGSCHPIASDLSTEQGVAALVADIRQMTASVDVLVNNAGATWGAPFEDYPASAFEKVVAINLTAPFLLTQALLPLLRAAGDEGAPARVINIGSADGIRTPSMETYAYSASKAGLLALTRHMAKTLVDDHILVNAIAPGPFDSKMMAFVLGNEKGRSKVAASVPAGRIGHPDDIAGVALFLAGAGAAYLVGETICVDGGVTNVA